MKRLTFVILIGLLAAWSGPSNALEQNLGSLQVCQAETSQAIPAGNAVGAGKVINAACCKVCIKGKACGNSCIKRTYTCTKPPGCACDGYKPDLTEKQLGL